ncbi:MAG: protein translocase subunit SecF [Dehalococcoidia bacterium]|nr:protein translocase subunit SecF [Dehalococcoidia bacterium]
MIDFVGRRFVYLYISMIMLVVAVVALATGGLKPGIEFSSGSTLTLLFKGPVTDSELRAELTTLGHGEATIQGTSRDGFVVTGGNLTADTAKTVDQAVIAHYGQPAVFTFTSDSGGATAYTVIFSHQVAQTDLEGVLKGAGITGAGVKTTSSPAFLIKTKTISQALAKDASGNALPSELDNLETALEAKYDSFGTFDFYSVDPSVASDVVRKAAIAVVVASLAILLYITFAFRKMPNPLRWGACAVIALLHDTLFVIGVFAILGLTLDMQVDAMFISAVLTVVGYSVHDTIVVFDRLRENIRLGVSKDFATTVDYSLNQTLGRSVSTSLTVVFVLLALLLIGGATIRTFVLTMLVGVIVGTYSSIFVASQLLVVWHKKEWRKLVPFLRSTQESKA